ncbi:BLUF domain-containing protein [Polynucleobacter sp. CS-Odin-A6]|uniref:BLUF domain-containing protein n=1 Tax=Polynucleobacter sp. CS-Odin-A6 TaxID=2689106 RepID=UPI001C0D2769|nr:BLUF domain-containing protein [Polynucleobacter sp. CS-Odin-A6]MBU3621849.1 BLUF domain-containing protein [Polynucleobacter sp. CS-Odin-A6]
MYQLIYVSSSTETFTREKFLDLAFVMSSQNTKIGITGMLVFKDGNFMEVLEGEESAVKELFSKIHVDPRHTLVSVIQEGDISAREYSSWAMTFYNSATEQYEHVGSPIQWKDNS